VSLAFLFPGQGSQKVGMGRALAEAFPEARAVYDEADAALGLSLSRLCFEGPAEELTLTAHAQPAILATSVAALRVLERQTGWRPDFVAGHSLGEYTALVAAGTLALADAVRVVHLRGKFMQEAVPPGVGAMAAIVGLDAVQVGAACEAARAEGGLVSPANLNGGGQVVIAGEAAAVARASALCKDRGARKALPLAVSAPFHCALMQPAADRLAAVLAEVPFQRPAMPVVTNVEADPCQDAATLRRLLVAQVTAPVRWEESVQRLVALGVRQAVELGAGTVLAGLCKRITAELGVRSAGDPESIAAVTAPPPAVPEEGAPHGS
jgi:[acyl-carrier-protein] S-malonyltransferase